jgi:hypothetical protein
MIIQSANRRLNVRMWTIAVLLDVVLAGAISYFLSPSDAFWINTFWIWLGLQVASLLLTLLGVLRLFVAKWAGAFKPARDGFMTALETQHFPAPEGVISSVDGYLCDVADGEKYNVDVRLAAAMLVGTRQGLKQTAGVVRWLMIDSAHEEGLQEYASRRHN